MQRNRTAPTTATFLAVALVISAASYTQADTKPLTEEQKIEALIKHVEALKDATFIRNGAEYDTKTAGKFMRGKWKANSDEIKTAKDFIEKAVSVSSTSGKPYVIRIKGGKDINSGDYLLAELGKLEKGS